MSKKDNEKKKKDGTAVAADEETAAPYPAMKLAQDMHRLTVRRDNAELEIKVFDEIAMELENPSLYRLLRDKLYPNTTPLSSSAKLTNDDLKEMEEKNAKTKSELEANIEKAIESAGDMEVMDARVALARFAAKSLSKADALELYNSVSNLPKVSSGKKIDAYMASARIASFYSDTKQADQYMDSANKLAKEGGGADWDRRNRLKVYKALQQLLHRDFEQASNLLLDCIATFSCTEICSYREFIVYTILTNILFLPRPDLKKKIIDGPEVLSVSKDIPIVLKLVRSFYDCDYKTYLHAMVELEDVLKLDRYLYPHADYWMRELHLLAYKQYLDSYQSVTITAMARAFGVSETFIDTHASRFIAAGSLSAKIDKFGGVIVSQRPDLKNAQYREMIQKGDLLLNRIQKLARVVDL